MPWNRWSRRGRQVMSEPDRRLIQICVAEGTGGADRLYGLANDGSVWQKINARGAMWVRLPELPRHG